MLQAVVTPELFPRLSQLAKSFQRIRYHRLRFEVVAGYPSMSSGTYVTGFVKDATDPVKEKTAATTLLASGGTAVKAWQSTEVVVGQLPDLYYTSTASSSERWSSPGSFVVAWTSPPSQDGSFSVYCHWDVTLSEATYEEDEDGDEVGFATSLVDAYTSENNTYLSIRTSNSWTPMLGSHFSPALNDGDVVTLMSFKFCSYENTSQALQGVYGFRTLKCVGTGKASRVKPVNELGGECPNPFYDETYVLFKGEKGELSRKTPNSLRGSWYLCPQRRSTPLSGTGLRYHPGLYSPYQEPPSKASTSSCQDSSDSSDPESTPLLEPSSMPHSSTSQDNSEAPPPSATETSLLSLVKRMERLLSLQGRSTELCEEFEMVPLETDSELA